MRSRDALVNAAGIIASGRCAALDLAPQRVRVNAVNPGVVVTTHPLGRVGTPEEMDLIAFLVSTASSTGETVAIDGGRHLTCLR